MIRLKRERKNLKGKNKKNKIPAIICGVVAGVSLFGIFGGIAIKSNGFTDMDVNHWFEPYQNNEGSLVGDVQEGQSMNVRCLSRNVDNEGHESMTFDVEVLPENASNKAFNISLCYVDGSDASGIGAYVTATKTSSSITVKMLQKFNKQIALDIVSVVDSNVKARVLIDCYKDYDLGVDNITLEIDDLETVFASDDDVLDGISIVESNGSLSRGITVEDGSYAFNLVSNALYVIGDETIDLTNNISANDLFHDCEFLNQNDSEGVSVPTIFKIPVFLIAPPELDEEFCLNSESVIVPVQPKSITTAPFVLLEMLDSIVVSTYEVVGTFENKTLTKNMTVSYLIEADLFADDLTINPTDINPETGHLIFDDEEEEEEEAETIFTYKLQQATSENAESPEYEIALTRYNDTDWFYINNYDVQYGKAYRVQIIATTGDQSLTTYSSSSYSWGNTGTGAFVFWTGEGDVSWDNCIKDLLMQIQQEYQRMLIMLEVLIYTLV